MSTSEPKKKIVNTGNIQISTILAYSAKKKNCMTNTLT